MNQMDDLMQTAKEACIDLDLISEDEARFGTSPPRAFNASRSWSPRRSWRLRGRRVRRCALTEQNTILTRHTQDQPQRCAPWTSVPEHQTDPLRNIQ